MDLRTQQLHGRDIGYLTAGSSGPTVVLVHGITQDASTWEPVGARLASHARLIAPDLPGHGRSQSQTDHSLGAYASTVRDLMLALDVERATIVGHSLGGGVALQFAYQFPDRVERLVLVDSGGLGREVSPMLRAASLPGADPVLRLLTTERASALVAGVSRGLTRIGLRLGTDLSEAWQGISGLSEAEARRAFLRTVRATIDLHGQQISAADKLYLAAKIPTLIVWGARDRVIPLHHAIAAHEAIDGSQLTVLDDAGHFPHLDQPATVAARLEEFLADTEAAAPSPDDWGALLRADAAESAG